LYFFTVALWIKGEVRSIACHPRRPGDKIEAVKKGVLQAETKAVEQSEKLGVQVSAPWTAPNRPALIQSEMEEEATLQEIAKTAQNPIRCELKHSIRDCQSEQ